MSSKIALLIDAENVSYKDLPSIFEAVARYDGEIRLKAVYGDWDSPNLQKWREIAEENALKLRHQANPSKIKNSSDMKLIMDAMEIMHWTSIDVFCLATNDADYIPLCHKIQEAGKQVIGIGYQHAAETFIRACNQFSFIGNRVFHKPAPVQPAQPATPPPSPLPLSEKPISPVKVRNLPVILAKAFAETSSHPNQWVPLSALGTALRQVEAGFQSKNYGHAKLSTLLKTLPDLVELQGTNGSSAARLRKDTTRPQKAKSAPVPVDKPQKAKNTPTKIEKLMSHAFKNATKDTEGWALLSTMGSVLSQIESGFQTNHYGHSSLTKLLQSMPDFVELRTKNGATSARLKKK